MGVSTILEPIARWRVSGDCSGPQGADGIDMLTRSAYDAMCAAAWTRDGSQPSMPVHDMARPRPSGQAYKAAYGYDADSRTQRSCCGAACYTFRIPDDALDDEVSATYVATADGELVEGKTYYSRTGSGTDLDPYVFAEVAQPDAADMESYWELEFPGGTATIASVTARIAVDRYCDAGACVFATVTGDMTPPPFGTLATLAQSGAAWFATGMQLDGAGRPVAPNARTRDGGPAVFRFDPPDEPARFLHVVLCLSDYVSVRGEWIEGGAMFSSASVEAEFSRPVAFASYDDVALLTQLSVGELDETSTDASVAAALARFPLVKAWANYTLEINGDAVNMLKDPGLDNAFANLLALILSPASLYAGAAGILSSSSATLAKTGIVGITLAQPADGGGVTGSNSVSFCALAAHGLTRGRTFRGIALEKPINPEGETSVPCRIAVYGVTAPQPHGSSTDWPRACTALPHWSAFMSRAFRDGAATSAPCLALPGLLTSTPSPEISAEAMSPSAATAVEVVPLASADVSGEVSRIAFDSPWHAGELSSVILAIVPDGAPQATAATETIDATVTRQATVVLPDSGASAATNTPVTHTFTLNRNSFDCEYQVEVPFLDLVTKGIAVRASLSPYGTWKFGTYQEKTGTVSAMVRLRVGAFSVQANGKTYTYTPPASGWLKSETRKVKFHFNNFWDKDTSSGGAVTHNSDDFTLRFSDLSVSCSVTAKASDGSSISVALTIPEASGPRITGTLEGAQFSWSSGYVYQAGITRNNPETWVFGYSFREWYGTSEMAVGASSFSATWPGNAYAWSDTVSGTVVGQMTVSGRAMFVRDGVTYTAEIAASTANATIGVNNKGTATVVAGGDTTTRCTVSGSLPAIDVVRQFSAPDGRILSARLLVPAQLFDSASADWGGALYMSARSVALGQAQSAASRTAHDSGQCVEIAQTSATVEIDLGTVSLYE